MRAARVRHVHAPFLSRRRQSASEGSACEARARTVFEQEEAERE